jgi:hypothetical protein
MILGRTNEFHTCRNQTALLSRALKIARVGLPCVFAHLRIDEEQDAEDEVVLYREEDGSCQFLEWLDKFR